MTFDVLVKLGIAILLGGAIGFQREISGRPAGLRTHMLVVLGVTLLCEASRHFGGGDPTRIAAQIVSGIGFLGAGTILRTGGEIRGLTSAASVWAASGIGMAVGAGGFMIIVAVIATALTLITLIFVDRIEDKYLHMRHQNRLALSVSSRAAIADILQSFSQHKIAVHSVLVAEEAGECGITVDISGPKEHAIELATACTGVSSARWVD